MSLSAEYFAIAQNYFPGGVNSPVRAFNGVGGTPLFISRADGPYVYDADGKQYIDFVGSWGPMILGHAAPPVVAAVCTAAAQGLSFGAPTYVETQLAQTIQKLMPNLEMMRFVSSGTEAAMSALRLARGYLRREKIIKFIGCYHGHSDSLLVQAGSGALTCGIPGSAGVTKGSTQDTLLAHFNQLEDVELLFKHYGADIAAVIIEPIAGNMNCVLPQPGFLAGLRELCSRHDALLIFDEVITGFRVAAGGAQAYYNVIPDLTVLGKIIGGGLPVGAFGGKRHIMQHLAPIGDVYQAGTLSGNPVAMSAGLATLTALQQSPECYDFLARNTLLWLSGLKELAQHFQIPFTYNHVGSLYGLFFNERAEINHFQHVQQSNIKRFQQFFHLMLAEGVYLAPSAFESGFVSLAHNEAIIKRALTATERAFAKLKQ